MQQNYRYNEKTFINPIKEKLANNILDYAGIIYDKPFNESFKRKIEMVQYRAALVITGAIKGTSHHRLYQELGLESLADRKWSRRLFFFHKIAQGFLPSYLRSYHNAVSEGAYLVQQHNYSQVQQLVLVNSGKNQSV